MEQKVKDDWIINNQNIFGLQQNINLSLSSIQYEILNQIEGKSINSISDYLNVNIDISKEIRGTKKITIEKVFSEFLGFENINPLMQRTFNCCLILNYLQLSLFKEYSETKHKNILTFSEYEKQYSSLLNSFLTANIDTDEMDFIKSEQSICDILITELNKPVYSVLSILNEVLDKPCEYKKNLTNSIDKRKKFLKQKAIENLKRVEPKETEKQNEQWYSEYELRQFIDMALRWGIDGVYKSRTENNPYSVFDHYVKNARTNFDLFANQLNRKLTKNDNWKAIGIDLNSRFVKGINQYINWYNENRNELKKFQPYCPYTLMLNVIESTKAEILKYFPDLEKITLPPQQNEKSKPELNKSLISFSSPEIIESLHNELKGYFQGSETELKRALKGEQLNIFLLFPHNQNKFVEVFKRLKYNGFLLSTPKETNDWICSNFTYQYQRGSKKEVRKFNRSTVHDILTKDKGEPTKNERICTLDWLPYKSYLTRQREAEKENI